MPNALIYPRKKKAEKRERKLPRYVTDFTPFSLKERTFPLSNYFYHQKTNNRSKKKAREREGRRIKGEDCGGVGGLRN